MKTIAVIGANGYAGKNLITYLCDRYRVIGVHRQQHEILQKEENVVYQHIDSEVPFIADVIINTAYSSNKNLYRNKKENIEVADYVRRHSSKETKIIHFSTQAVFGYQMSLPIVGERINNRLDELYIESKIHMENVLLDSMPNRNIQILRIGNIWGPGSSWCTQVNEALVFGMPCLDKTSFSNITYIRNLKKYIEHLILSDQKQTFHHVADMSAVQWNTIILTLADALKVDPRVLNPQQNYPGTLLQEINPALFLNPVAFIQKMKNGRFLSSRINALVEDIPPSIKSIFRKNKTNTAVQPSMPIGFLLTMSCRYEFKPLLLNGFEFPYDQEYMLNETTEWMHRSGYILETV